MAIRLTTHSAAYYRAVDQAFFAQCFKFTFVRNPWDRLVSAYHLLRRGHTDYVRVWSPQKYSDLLELSFDDFVRVWLWKRRDQLMELDTTLWTQTYFTHSPEGEPLVDFVGRCETLEQDLLYLNEERNLAIQNMHLNRKPESPRIRTIAVTIRTQTQWRRRAKSMPRTSPSSNIPSEPDAMRRSPDRAAA